MGRENVLVAGVGKEEAELMVICDQEGNEYNLTVIPDRDSPIIRESSASILQEICKNVAAAYKWLLKGKEQMALMQFKKCAVAASALLFRWQLP